MKNIKWRRNMDLFYEFFLSQYSINMYYFFILKIRSDQADVAQDHSREYVNEYDLSTVYLC